MDHGNHENVTIYSAIVTTGSDILGGKIFDELEAAAGFNAQ